MWKILIKYFKPFKNSSLGCRFVADILIHPTWKHCWTMCIRWTEEYKSSFSL